MPGGVGGRDREMPFYSYQSMRFAKLGLVVDAIDLEAPMDAYAQINKKFSERIHYIQTNIANIPDKFPPKQYALVYSNRFLSHIPYQDAKRLLTWLVQHALSGCHFFLSFSHLDTLFEDKYKDYDKPIEERFSALQSEQSKIQQLTEPLCLYTREDILTLIKNIPLNLLDEFNGTASIKMVFKKK